MRTHAEAPPRTPDDPRPNTEPTLQRTWRRAVATFVVLIVAVGVLAIGTTHVQGAMFDRTTSQLERLMGAVVHLESHLLEVDEPAAGMMYGLGGPARVEEHVATYEDLRGHVEEAFDALEDEVATSSPAVAASVADARAAWSSMDTLILAAPARGASGEVAESLAQGIDPFKEAWDELSRVTEELGALRGHFVDDLGVELARADRLQRAIPPVVLGTLVLALLFAWLVARGLRRRVLTPILAVREAAAAMQDSRLYRPLELGRTVSELADLARTIDATARSLRASHEQLWDQAHTDDLTGLMNRKGFVTDLHERLDASRTGRTGVLFIDLDDFKVVNDSLGHAAGDELLRVIGRRLSEATRDGETVARLGGDEFAIILDCGPHENLALTVAARVLAALQEPVVIDGNAAEVGCSIGVAHGAADAGSSGADELIRNADFAMYTAKRQGKNRIEVFVDSMHSEMQSRLELRSDLDRALVEDQFELHYQPVLDLASGRTLGLEALIRWQHPTRGLLAPAAFLALTEDTGHIVEVGSWVIDRACRDLREQLDGGLAPDGLWISVNVSARQLSEPDFVTVVRSALERHGVAAASLILEITEAVAVTNTESAADVLTELRRQGVRIALDDFGMGFSSLHYLNELPVDVIKIDRSFVSGEARKTMATLGAIVELSRNLDLAVIAEGIETPAQLTRLRELGDIAGQGYLFARPMPRSAVSVYLEASEEASVTPAG